MFDYVDENRMGDHICYISLNDTIGQIVRNWQTREVTA